VLVLTTNPEMLRRPAGADWGCFSHPRVAQGPKRPCSTRGDTPRPLRGQDSAGCPHCAILSDTVGTRQNRGESWALVSHCAILQSVNAFDAPISALIRRASSFGTRLPERWYSGISCGIEAITSHSSVITTSMATLRTVASAKWSHTNWSTHLSTRPRKLSPPESQPASLKTMGIVGAMRLNPM
jgi:hypothetical protein